MHVRDCALARTERIETKSGPNKQTNEPIGIKLNQSKIHFIRELGPSDEEIWTRTRYSSFLGAFRKQSNTHPSFTKTQTKIATMKRKLISQKCFQLLVTILLLNICNYTSDLFVGANEKLNKQHSSLLNKRQVSWLRWWSYDSISGE